MGVDYYKILQVDKNAKYPELTKAYEKLASKWLPDMNPTNRQKAESIFLQISEAYDVLSDSEKRAIYDEYGEEVLKGQVPLPSSGVPNVFKFDLKDADDIYAEHFIGFTKDPLLIEKTLPCTLEELYNGTNKKIKISREIIVDKSGKTMLIEETLTTYIYPGWGKGTTVTFYDKGDEKPKVIPSDVAFIIDEVPHSVFTRDGIDLIVTQKISPAQALSGYTVCITTLDGRKLTIPINGPIHPSYEKVIPGEGMRYPHVGEKGNLRIKFDIGED